MRDIKKKVIINDEDPASYPAWQTKRWWLDKGIETQEQEKRDRQRYAERGRIKAQRHDEVWELEKEADRKERARYEKQRKEEQEKTDQKNLWDYGQNIGECKRVLEEIREKLIGTPEELTPEHLRKHRDRIESRLRENSVKLKQLRAKLAYREKQ